MAELVLVVGARPNFVKVAPLYAALAEDNDLALRLLHTGQHYDRRLSEVFFEQLGLPEPDHHLGVGSGTHGEQTAAVIVGVERVLVARPADALIVAGDVNSTMGAALAAVKLGIPVVHVESGLRSGDWTMPEEVNRVVVDRIADLLLCHSQEAVDNLRGEGIAGEHVALVGNTMIDSLFRLQDAARARRTLDRLGLEDRGFALVTLHRPALVDDPQRLLAVVEVLAELAGELPVVFPLHPRTRSRIAAAGPDRLGVVRALEPLDYLDFIDLESSARLVVTDSGGVQEETSALGVPCLTYRDSTERGVTAALGTNRLVGTDPAALRAALWQELGRPSRPDQPPVPLWDGRAGVRAAAAVRAMLDARTWTREPSRTF